MIRSLNKQGRVHWAMFILIKNKNRADAIHPLTMKAALGGWKVTGVKKRKLAYRENKSGTEIQTNKADNVSFIFSKARFTCILMAASVEPTISAISSYL